MCKKDGGGCGGGDDNDDDDDDVVVVVVDDDDDWAKRGVEWVAHLLFRKQISRIGWKSCWLGVVLRENP